jgi:hypothetical protein
MTGGEQQTASKVFDTTIALGALAYPYWAVSLENWLHIIAGAGGIVLLAIRILIAWKEYRKR